MLNLLQGARNVAWFIGYVVLRPWVWWRLGLIAWSQENLQDRFAWIRERDAARCGQRFVSERQADILALGIRSIINLRGHNRGDKWWDREFHFARDNDIEHFDTEMSSRFLPERRHLVVLLDALKDAPRPFLLKCAGGQDRTGFAAALYMISCEGWSGHELALHHFDRWPGPRAQRNQEWLQIFFRYAKEEARGDPIATWIRQSYRREAFVEWLDRHGLRNTYTGLQR